MATKTTTKAKTTKKATTARPAAKSKKPTKISASRSGVSDGDKAPLFHLETDDSGKISLADLRGKNVILYFYPKDDTSGCTAQACAFQKDLSKFKKLNTVVIGVSPDPIKSHEKFRHKYQLGFHLGSDTEKKVCEDYGVWVEKSMYGRKYMGVERSTFLIDSSGKIAKAWRKVKVDGHIEEVLASLK